MIYRSQIQLREYRPSDCVKLAGLFYETVHCVNARDYTEAQLNAWATGEVDLDDWNRSFSEHHTVIAVENYEITGFGDIDASGYLDRLYVHMDHQGEGIATAICDELERSANGKKITTHASITAKRFFLDRGYRVVREQEVLRHGVLLTNFIMEKQAPQYLPD